MTVPEFDEGPSKRICDDLGLANMIVKSSEDLTMPPGYPVKSAILDDEVTTLLKYQFISSDLIIVCQGGRFHGSSCMP